MLKRVLKSQFAAGLAASVLAGYLRLVDATTTKSIAGAEHYEKVRASGRGIILAFWHGRLMMAPFLTAPVFADIYMLVSANRDGDIIAGAVRPYPVKFIRGSAFNPRKPQKSKGGASAVAQSAAALSEGGIVGVTPDGPRGPAEAVQAGVVKLAQMSGAAIIPVGAAAAPAARLSSWDRFMLAAPFGRIAFVLGPPIEVGSEVSQDAFIAMRENVRAAICSATQRADAIAGRKGASE
ncbi:MAG: lysophospholipid acyltransferase family protein [Pseudomonadota bacterium]